MILLQIPSDSFFSSLPDRLQPWMQPLSMLAITSLALLGLIVLMGKARLLVQGHKLRKEARADAEFLESCHLAEQTLEIYLSRRVHARSSCYAIYETVCRELCQQLVGSHTINSELLNRLRAAGRITPTQMETIRRAAEHSTQRAIAMQPDQIGKVTLSALALLGFAGSCMIAMEKSLHGGATLYPALLPITIAALLIPPFLIWRQSHERLKRRARLRMHDLMDHLLREIDRRFVDHRKPLESLPSLEAMSFADGPTFSQSPAKVARPQDG